MSAHELDPSPHPAQSYTEACARFQEIVDADSEAVDPLSRSRLLTPGGRSERAIVFLHGLTNSPRQFSELSERFVARGYAVLLPRVPYHGYSDRMTTEHGQLTRRDLVDTVAWAVDIASGLADDVTVCGLSMGGVLAVWAAQHRSIAFAVPIAASIGLPKLPVFANSMLFGALERLPNRFMWWDPRVKENLPGPPYAYPRFSTWALARTQRLGLTLLHEAREAPPRARGVLVVTNAADLAVSNASSKLLVKRWRAAGAANVHSFQFPRHYRLFHDLIDPLQPNAQTELVHGVLEQMIVERRPRHSSA